MILIDQDIAQTIRHEALTQLVGLAENKGYTNFKVSTENVFVGKKDNSIAIIFEPSTDNYDLESVLSTSVSLYDDIIFREQFKDELFKEVTYKDQIFVVDKELRVVRQSSRESEIIIGNDNYTIMQENITYENAMIKMLEIMNKKIEQEEKKNENKSI